MSHLANYAATLAADIDPLTICQKKVRIAVGQHLSRHRYGGARELVRRFRRLSMFMRMGWDSWPRAVDRLFSLDYEAAENMITRYRKWVDSRPWSSRTKITSNAWGFLVLSRDLKEQGG